MASAVDTSLPLVGLLDAKISELKSRLSRVDLEPAELRNALGRILGQDVVAFRDSPSIDVSAMDGYAVRLQDLVGNALPIADIAKAGSPPLNLSPGTAIRIFTGGPVPTQADCVIKREDCHESESYVSIALSPSNLSKGQNIRRQGENAKKGITVLRAADLISAEKLAAAITFSESTQIQIRRKVRIAILNTGDELYDMNQSIEPWQIRDSNGPYLEASLSRHAWTEICRQRVADCLDATRKSIEESLQRSDVILLTGGVSMGDTDYVPDAITDLGCRIVFHRLPIRPGKPVLGAVGPGGQLILGLPGNPMSVAVTFRRIGLELIQHVAGMNSVSRWQTVQVQSDDEKQTDLTWFRLARWLSRDTLTLVSNQGSGDIAAMKDSDGFIEVAPNQTASGPKPFFAWSSIG